MLYLRKIKIKDWHFLLLIVFFTAGIYFWGTSDSKKSYASNADNFLTELDAHSFTDSVASRVSFVLFYIDDCNLCERAALQLYQIAQKGESDISFFKVNVEKHPVLSGHYHVSGTPSVVILNDGKAVNRIMGVVPQQNYELIYNRYVKQATQYAMVDN